MNNETAFPTPKGSHYENTGMTLRDYFAAKAMQLFVRTRDCSTEEFAKSASENAYIVADAMLKARDQ